MSMKPSNVCQLFICWGYLLLLFTQSTHASMAGYFVGNSLTWDSQPNGIAALANENGNNLSVGYHIRSGASIDYIWNNPNDITIANSFGGYASALPANEWDFVTIQPHHSVGSTLSLDTQAIVNFIGLNESGPSSSTNYYIYAAWPLQTSDYQSVWTQSISDALDQQTTHAREYFDHLYSNVSSALGDGISLHLIPVGEVLYSLELLFESGAVPGFSNVSQLYRDGNHLDVDIGRWVAANTVYATVFKEDPTGLGKPVGYYVPVGDTLLTDELNSQIQSIVWDVVSNDVRTGVVPIPAAIWLFASAIVGIGFIRNRVS